MEKSIPSSWRVELEDELTKLMSEKDPAPDVTMFNTLVVLIDDDLRTPVVNKTLIKADIIKRLIRIKGLQNRPLFDSYLITVWRILVSPSEKSNYEGASPYNCLINYLYGLLGHTIRMSKSWDPPKGISEGKMVSYLNVQASTMKKNSNLKKDPLILMIDLLGPRTESDYMSHFVKAWNKSYQEFPNFLQISGLVDVSPSEGDCHIHTSKTSEVVAIIEDCE